MAANTSNRETCRDQLATLLGTALVGTGKPAQAVYNYSVSTFNLESPAVAVVSAGSRRQQHGLGTSKLESFITLVIMVYIQDEATGESWTAQNVDDRLDLIEKTIMDVIADNRGVSAYWSELYPAAEGSKIYVVPPKDVEGKPYRVEIIPVEARVIDA